LGRPKDIVKKIIPSLGTFVFFEVTPISYHEVQEVLSKRNRYSISGWFSGPIPKEFLRPTKDSFDFSFWEKSILSKWIQSTYLNEDSIIKIANKFAEDSCIQLYDFLLPSVYNSIIAFLNTHNIFSTRTGPADRKRYLTLSINALAELDDTIIRQFIDFLNSRIFHSFLNRVLSMAGPDVFPYRESHPEIRRFSSGDYTLLLDEDVKENCMSVDVTLFLQTDNEWNSSWGGVTYYMAEEETLISIEPGKNKLSIVLKDKGTAHFVKRLTTGNPDRIDAVVSYPYYYDFEN